MPSYGPNQIGPLEVGDKHPDDDYDWVFDFRQRTSGTGPTGTDALRDGEFIAASTITVDNTDLIQHDKTQIGITVDPGDSAPIQLTDNTAVRVFLSGGVLGNAYIVTCQIVTTSVPPRTLNKSMKLRVSIN